MIPLTLIVEVLASTFILSGLILLWDSLRKNRKQKRLDALMWRVRGTR